MTSRTRRAFARSAGAAALAGATLATQAFIAVPAQSAAVHRSPAGGAGWRLDKTISIRDKEVLLLSLDAVSASDAWAAGFVTSEYGTSAPPLIEHWNGTAWRQIVLPGKLAHRVGPDLFGYVGASSETNVWVVSVEGHYLRRSSGGRWSMGTLPGARRGSVLIIDSVETLSRTDVWALGVRVDPQFKSVPYAARFNGRQWTTVRVPGSGPISQVSVISPRDIWAVAGGTPPLAGRTPTPSRVLHWNGVAWRAMAVQPRLPRHASLTAILAKGGSDIWVGGSVLNSRRGTCELARHWNGRTWISASPRAAASPGAYAITSLTPAPGGGIWALSTDFDGPARVWRYSDGTWSAPTRLPWDLYRFESVPHSRSIWAIGENAGATAALIALHGPVPRS